MDWLYDLGRKTSAVLNIRMFAVHGVEVTVGGVGAFVLTIVVAILLGRFSKRGLVRVLQRGAHVSDEGKLYALGRIVQYAVTSIGILIGLENIGFSFTTLAAVGAVFAVGLGFGLQNVAQNFISGLILLFERPIKKGDIVTVQGNLGVVEEIAIRATRVVTFDEVALIVPNSKLISDIVENRSEPTAKFRVKVDVNVAYGSDTKLVERILLEVARTHAGVLGAPEPTAFLNNFGESSLAFQLCAWVPNALAAGSVASDLRHAILHAFEGSGVSIAVPQRELRMRPANGSGTDGETAVKRGK